MELRQELAAGTTQLGITTTAAQVDTLLAYIALLQKWNSAFNLVGTSNSQELVQKHLLDSIAIGPFIENSPVLDVGSGAGLPGIPLAITLPKLSFRLLDANNKKVRFMRQAAIELNLSNIEIIHSRVENYRPEQAPRTVISRAFAPLEKALDILSGVCADGGQVLLMLGERAQNSTAQTAYKNIATHAIRVPGLQSQRHLVIAEKGSNE